LRQSKWKQEKRDLKVGDVVLWKDETAAGQTYKYAKVTKVHTSADGKVRAADIEYKLPGESVFRTTTVQGQYTNWSLSSPSRSKP
jgi:hypothetical protein